MPAFRTGRVTSRSSVLRPCCCCLGCWRPRRFRHPDRRLSRAPCVRLPRVAARAPLARRSRHRRRDRQHRVGASAVDRAGRLGGQRRARRGCACRGGRARRRGALGGVCDYRAPGRSGPQRAAADAALAARASRRRAQRCSRSRQPCRDCFGARSRLARRRLPGELHGDRSRDRRARHLDRAAACCRCVAPGGGLRLPPCVRACCRRRSHRTLVSRLRRPTL